MRHLSPEWQSNRKRMFQKVDDLKETAKIKKNEVWLHLGCGAKHIYEGFINVDKYTKDDRITNFDMAELPYDKNSVDLIYSSHALEHLNYRTAMAAIKNWADVLKPGGELYLAIPDLEEVMKIMVNPSVGMHAKWRWFIYHIYGYQADPDVHSPDDLSLDIPDDPGQHHRCGFSKELIEHLLRDAGFRIKVLRNYDGWNIPSIWVEASKT